VGRETSANAGDFQNKGDKHATADSRVGRKGKAKRCQKKVGRGEGERHLPRALRPRGTKERPVIDEFSCGEPGAIEDGEGNWGTKEKKTSKKVVNHSKSPCLGSVGFWEQRTQQKKQKNAGRKVRPGSAKRQHSETTKAGQMFTLRQEKFVTNVRNSTQRKKREVAGDKNRETRESKVRRRGGKRTTSKKTRKKHTKKTRSLSRKTAGQTIPQDGAGEKKNGKQKIRAPKKLQSNG